MNTVDAPGAALGGRYKLMALAGCGGMAEVWRAQALGAAGFSRTVAVKRILPHLADAGNFREMFVEEARVNAMLDHPGIVQVFDFGEDATGMFLVMEWVDGITLLELCDAWRLQGKPPSPGVVSAVGIEVLKALHAAHTNVVPDPDGSLRQRAVIHRDVSPSNVLLSSRGVVKLTDFGLARALDRARLTPAGIVKGKLAYLAPELLRGEQATALSDVYGAGVMLWEALCGRRLYDGMSDGEIVRALMNGRPTPPIRSVRADVPAAVAEAVERALFVDPAERHRSAGTFARALSDALRRNTERTDAGRLATEVTVARARLRRRATPPPVPTVSAAPFPLVKRQPKAEESWAHLIPVEYASRAISLSDLRRMNIPVIDPEDVVLEPAGADAGDR